MKLRWDDIKADLDTFTGEVEVPVADNESIVGVERIQDGGYNTEYVRVWIAVLR